MPLTGELRLTQTQQRALQLAASGQYRTVTELKVVLRREGRRGLGHERQSPDLRRMLRAVIAGARMGEG